MFKVDEFEIPAYVKYKPRTRYRVLWIDQFNDAKQLGECCYDSKQIVLKKSMKPRQAFWVLFHELLHAISFEKDLNLTEKQVETIEMEFERLVKLNKWF